ncbi:MAG: four-helix bundle copper-binding protein [Isosphaeraceae bacterium]|nr:four-helix bundle copper-binding protein [Isosphaeraceae bacterium]
MDRRELLAVLGTGAVGLAALSGREARAAHTHRNHHQSCDACMEACIKACGECAKICNEMAAHCLEQLCEGKGDREHHAKSHSLGNDCQAFCVLSAQMMARDSALMAYSCGACAQACKACAEECEKEKGSEIMSECAEMCRKCEASCHEMVKMLKA